jgi:hypothetical protein
MADQYTPEEIAEIFEAYNNAIKTNTPISAELAKQMQDATKGFRGATDALNKFGKSLGTSAIDLGKSLYKGEKGVGQFGDAVEMAANAIQAAILAIPGIGIAAKIATVAMVALAKGVNAAAKQGDALYKTYQDLGRAGATASDGISGVFRNMQNLGYGIEELDKMVALVTQNSETLAKFSLTAADGTNAFAQGMAQIQRDGSLRILGKTTDDINSAGAAFIRQNVRAGISQTQIGNQLGAQTKAYILELDRLQRLTGTSADALQKQQDEAMAEDAYNDVMTELKQRALAGDEVAKEQIKKIGATMASLSPEMQKEFQKSIGGDISAQQKMFMRMPSLMKNVMDESVGTAQTMKEGERDINNFINTFGRSYRMNSEGMREFAGTLSSAREEALQFGNFDARDKAAAKNTAVTDKATQSLTEAQIANMNSRDAMQAFIQKGVAPATAALAGLAKVASGVAGAAAGAVGAPTGGAAAGSKAPGTMDYKKEFGGGGAAGATSLGNLRIKSPEAYSGGETSQQLMTVAQAIQDKLGGDLKHFSAFNDSYHRGPNSLHGQGRALDFTITDPDKAAAVADMVRSIPGISKVIDEYANPSGRATAPHIHAEISAANGAILSGPASGYKPNLTMHGTEAIVPLNSPAAQSAFGSSDQTSIMSAQLDKLDELVRVMQNQVSVSTKILQAAN